MPPHITAQIFRCFFLCFYGSLPPREGCVLREYLGLPGVDISWRPSKSIRWLSDINRCAERPTCLILLQSTSCVVLTPEEVSNISGFGRCDCTGAFPPLYIADICCFAPWAYRVFMSGFFCLFPWTWCFFYSPSALFLFACPWFPRSDSHLSWFSLHPSLIIHISHVKFLLASSSSLSFILPLCPLIIQSCSQITCFLFSVLPSRYS